jgi:hypothetical protein
LSFEFLVVSVEEFSDGEEEAVLAFLKQVVEQAEVQDSIACNIYPVGFEGSDSTVAKFKEDFEACLGLDSSEEAWSPDDSKLKPPPAGDIWESATKLRSCPTCSLKLIIGQQCLVCNGSARGGNVFGIDGAAPETPKYTFGVVPESSNPLAATARGGSDFGSGRIASEHFPPTESSNPPASTALATLFGYQASSFGVGSPESSTTSAVDAQVGATGETEASEPTSSASFGVATPGRGNVFGASSAKLLPFGNFANAHPAGNVATVESKTETASSSSEDKLNAGGSCTAKDAIVAAGQVKDQGLADDSEEPIQQHEGTRQLTAGDRFHVRPDHPEYPNYTGTYKGSGGWVELDGSTKKVRIKKEYLLRKVG